TAAQRPRDRGRTRRRKCPVLEKAAVNFAGPRRPPCTFHSPFVTCSSNRQRELLCAAAITAWHGPCSLPPRALGLRWRGSVQTAPTTTSLGESGPPGLMYSVACPAVGSGAAIDGTAQ